MNPDADSSMTLTERKALAYFSQVAAGEVFGYLASDLWTHLVPQRCHVSPVIRSAIVALSSIHQDFTAACDITSPGETVLMKGILKSDQLYAVAVVHLRTYIENAAMSSKQEVLLACAVLICFTLLRRRPEEATRHLDKGASILRSWRQEMKCLDSSSWKGTEHDDFETIADAYCALDVHASAYNDSRLPCLKPLDQESGTVLNLNTLDHFVNLGHAQQTLMRLISMASVNLIQCTPYKFHPIRMVPQDLVSGRQSIRVSFRTWLMSLNRLEMQQDVWSSGAPTETRKTRTAFAAMRTQHLAIATLLNETLCENDGVSAFLFDAQAYQLLHWAELAISECEPTSSAKTATPSARRTFSVDLGIGPPLFLLAIKTSQPAIRSRAVSLLSRIRRLEGWYDPSAVVSSIGYLYALQDKGSVQNNAFQLSGSTATVTSVNLESAVEEASTEIFRAMLLL